MTPRGLVEELIDAWAASDSLRAAAFFTSDGRYLEAGREPIAGRTAIGEHFAKFFRDGPQWRFELDEIVVEGQRVALAYRFFTKGSDGSWRERAGCAMVRLREGLVEEWREYQG
jgi:predicted SnoaL-like aldol condensation-catalyzing enzyme